MSKNNSWLIWLVAIVAVVALIVAIVALGKISATGEAINFRANKFIVANSCDADNTCEANAIHADEGIFYKIFGIEDKLGLYSSNTLPLGATGSQILLLDGGLVVLEQDLWIKDKLTVQGITEIKSLSANASNMIPTGSVAYVCVDINGVLFKKNSSCI